MQKILFFFWLFVSLCSFYISCRIKTNTLNENILYNLTSLLSTKQEKTKELTDKTITILTGNKKVIGNGIEVILSENMLLKNNSSTNTEYMEKFLIHEQDLLRLRNELLLAGTEAIAINGQRLVTNSTIRCVGPTIRVNDITIASPYKILAIGEPYVLKSSLTLMGGIIDILLNRNINVKIKTKKHILIPAFDKNVDIRYSKIAN